MGKRVRVVPLKCPDCGNRLLGLEQDKVFFCGPCRKAYELEKSGFEPRPLFFARPVIEYPRVPVVFLPFYRFRVEFVADSDDRRQILAAERYKDLDTIWVMGFNLIRPSYFGDLGLLYTEARVQVEKEDDTYGKTDRFRVAGCARTVDEAKIYTKLFILLMIDKREDITGMELSPLIHETSLWAIPFYDFQDKLLDAIMGREFPVFAIDDIEALRASLGPQPPLLNF
jgi:hypothetical protein